MKRVPSNLGDSGTGLSRGHKIRGRDGDYYLLDILESVHAEAATVAEAQAIGYDATNGVLLVRSTLFGDGRYRWSATSTRNDSTGQLAIRPDYIESADPGRWLRDDVFFQLVVQVSHETVDDGVLYTLPSDVRMQLVGRPFADVSVSFASVGGAALGISSSNAAYNTDGDLFGGASGSLSAALAAGLRGGTIGAKLASSGLVVLVGGDTIKANLFTSTFEAGAAKVYFPVCRV